MQLGRVTGTPNDIDSQMAGVDQKAVTGKFAVDEVFFIVIIIRCIVTIARGVNILGGIR